VPYRFSPCPGPAAQFFPGRPKLPVDPVARPRRAIAVQIHLG